MVSHCEPKYRQPANLISAEECAIVGSNTALNVQCYLGQISPDHRSVSRYFWNAEVIMRR